MICDYCTAAADSKDFKLHEMCDGQHKGGTHCDCQHRWWGSNKAPDKSASGQAERANRSLYPESAAGHGSGLDQLGEAESRKGGEVVQNQ